MVWPAAVVRVLFHLFTEIGRPFRAVGVDPVHVVAVFWHFVLEHRLHDAVVFEIGAQRLEQIDRFNAMLVVYELLERGKRIRQVGDLNHLDAGQVVFGAAARHVFSDFQAIVDHA